MNIYKVSREDGAGYDEYDSFVCVAENEEQAKLMFPDPDSLSWGDSRFHLQIINDDGNLGLFDEENNPVVDVDFLFNSWVNNINNIEVELVGVADAKYTMSQVIVASFNAW